MNNNKIISKYSLLENIENLQKLIDIGLALSREKNISILLEKILNEARTISNSDGGTVYLINNNNTKLSFEIMHTSSLNIKYGGSSIRDFKNTNGDNGSFQKKFKIYGRKGDACSRNNCKGKIIKFSQTNRSTYMCQICQK